MNLRATNQANPNQISKSMSPEQFTQVVDAILEGKYSWACVLILRFAGYNPLHYIPYRTYNRLVKEHCQNSNSQGRQLSYLRHGNQLSQLHDESVEESLKGIDDLDHLEVIGRGQQLDIRIKGGCKEHYINKKNDKGGLFKKTLLWRKIQGLFSLY